MVRQTVDRRLDTNLRNLADLTVAADDANAAVPRLDQLVHNSRRRSRVIR